MDLALVKSHLRIDTAEYDALVLKYIEVAEEYVRKYLDKTIYDTQDAFDEAEATTEDGIVRDNKIDLTVMQLVGHLYEYRELLPATGHEVCDQLLITDKRIGV